jgi:hypothetical protein
MKYYLVDYGKQMLEAATILTDFLTSQGHHYVVYLTNAEGLMCIEEIDENEFLDHFKKQPKHDTKNGN